MPKEFVKAKIGNRTRLIEVVRWNGSIGTGWRVTKSGERWENATATTIENNLIIFNKSSVIRQMRMNLHYGELEEVT